MKPYRLKLQRFGRGFTPGGRFSSWRAADKRARAAILHYGYDSVEVTYKDGDIEQISEYRRVYMDTEGITIVHTRRW